MSDVSSVGSDGDRERWIKEDGGGSEVTKLGCIRDRSEDASLGAKGLDGSVEGVVVGGDIDKEGVVEVGREERPGGEGEREVVEIREESRCDEGEDRVERQEELRLVQGDVSTADDEDGQSLNAERDGQETKWVAGGSDIHVSVGVGRTLCAEDPPTTIVLHGGHVRAGRRGCRVGNQWRGSRRHGGDCKGRNAV
jgi:hypothetical protein